VAKGRGILSSREYVSMKGHEAIRDGERMVGGGEAAGAQGTCSCNFDSVPFALYLPAQERSDVGDVKDERRTKLMMSEEMREEKRKKKEKNGKGEGREDLGARPALTSICLVTVYRYEG